MYLLNHPSLIVHYQNEKTPSSLLDKNQTKWAIILYIFANGSCLAMCTVHLHYFCLEITTLPNVCINISNQGPLPLVRDEKGEHPWEKRERGALHSK